CPRSVAKQSGVALRLPPQSKNPATSAEVCKNCSVRNHLRRLRDNFQAARESLTASSGERRESGLPDYCFGTLISSKLMKHKFSNIRFVLGVIAIGCIGLSGTAFAQNPRMFPTATPNSSGSSEQGTVKSESDSN